MDDILRVTLSNSYIKVLFYCNWESVVVVDNIEIGYRIYNTLLVLSTSVLIT